MGHVIANVDRAGGHLVIMGVLLGIAAAAGLIYGAVHRIGKKRAGRTPSDREPRA